MTKVFRRGVTIRKQISDSHYKLGEAEFVDSGPAGVDGLESGSWDHTTESLVVGESSLSSYAGGSGYFTIERDNSVHAFPAVSIAIYMQDNNSPGRVFLFSASGSATVEPGDLSVELTEDGALRGYHVSAGGVLEYFESSQGVTGTNLKDSDAHLVVITMGPDGVKLSLDKTELTAAAIPGNKNGWNNGRIKYVNKFNASLGTPGNTAYDEIQIWGRQLTDGEISALPSAQTISIGGGPPSGDELSVPSLAEWLPSDESDPSVTKYVSNQNRGNGSGSSPANAQEVQAALNGASPGDTFLAIAQTPGTIEHWSYPSGLSFPNGSAGNLITLQARNGDGIVINAGEEYAGARTPNSGFWTQSGLSQADIDKKIWRSSSTFTGGDEDMIGMWIEFDHPHQLLRYGSMSNLRAPYGTADSFTNYAGPGVHQDSDGTLYIRMQKPHPDKYSARGTWTTSLWPNNPEAVNGSGQLVYPVSENPNNYVMYIAKTNPSGTLNAFNPASGAGNGYFKIGAGINSCMFRRALQGGAQNIQIDRGTHLCWQIICFGTDANYLTDIYMNRARFSDGSKKHVSRGEWKFGGPLTGIRSVGFAIMSRMKNVNCKDCTFADFHEMGTFGASHSSADGEIRFRNCTFFNVVNEGFQGRVGQSRWEVGYCFFLNCGFWGQGVSGTEDEEWDPGKWFIHHNIFDVRAQHCLDWRLNPGPCILGFRHSPDQYQPQKIYNNIFFWGPDQEEEAECGIQHLRNHNVPVTGTDKAHEVFNNIVIRHDVQRYNTEYSRNLTNQTDFVAGRQNVSADLSNEFWDYNLYYRDVPGPLVNGVLDTVQEGRNTNPENFATLAAFQGSSKFTLSKASGSKRGAYTPGFEANSTETKPTLASLDDFPASRFQYRPSATSAVMEATNGATSPALPASLSGADWWTSPPSWGTTYFSWSAGGGSLAPSPWKGALDPEGSTITVGVQNP